MNGSKLHLTIKKNLNFLKSLNNLDQGKHIFKKKTFKVNWNKQKTYLKINFKVYDYDYDYDYDYYDDDDDYYYYYFILLMNNWDK